ncbi:YIEGIA family protein [Cohnella fermenti]|nr:YIEGIA family protein [Cohnella fermenti]
MGTVIGVATRFLMLKSDYRQYPAYPHGKIIHLALGTIAAALGSVAVPALLKKDFTAITFLGMAAQQFREVRNMERNTLSAIDQQELVPRGITYIEGTAVVFEGRNYLSILAAFLTSLGVALFGWIVGAIVGILCLLIVIRFRRGKTIKDAATIEFAEVEVDGPDVSVGGIYMMNVGLEDNQRIIREIGMGFVLTPRSDDAKVTISNLGQRQAILHDVSVRLGVYRDDGEPALLPLAKLDLHSGRLGILLLPREHDREVALRAVSDVPLLEAAVRMPTEANHRKGGAMPNG